jgi:hypothetical protein
MNAGPAATSGLSLPPRVALPRPLTPAELQALKTVADALIPAASDDPAATAEPGFDEALVTALTARADAFEGIMSFLHRIEGKPAGEIADHLRDLHRDNQSPFQPLSAVVAGAWLLLPTVRQRIGYPGQHRNPPAIDQAVDELSSGILEPVIERGPIYVQPPGQ